jgi:hypothetical protein
MRPSNAVMVKGTLGMRSVMLCSLAGVLFLSPAAALANDGFFAGSGSNVYPVENLDVRLVREVVTFDQIDTEEHVFAVSALLFFQNETADTVKGQVGFPDGGTSIHDLMIFVDGTRVDSLRFGTYTTADGTPSDNVYLFDMAFPPGKLATVLHNYLLAASWYNDGSSILPYAFRTGGLWRGSIGEAVFQYRLSHPLVSPQLRYAHKTLAGWDWTSRATGREGVWITSPLSEAEAGVDYTFDYVPGPRPTFTATFRDIDPTGDLGFWYNRGGGGGILVFSFAEIACKEAGLGMASGKGCYWELSRFLRDFEVTPELLACYDPSILRNLMYARRGYHFQNEGLNRLFYENEFFMPSSAPFDSTWFTRDEVRVIEELRRIEAQQSEAP